MKIRFHNNFKKQYKKLRAIQKKIDERLVLFMRDPTDPILNDHSLEGKYKLYRSINITVDYRALYKLIDDDIAYFIIVDTHSNLYG